MKVLALLTDGFGAAGGIARYNQDFITALAVSPAVRAVSALPRHGAAQAETPARVAQHAPAGRVAWSAHALRLAASERFDVVFCGHLRAAPLAAAVAGLARAPLWLQAHGVEAWARPGAAVRRAAARAALVTCVSRRTRERLLRWCDIEPARVCVLPNTLGARFTPGPASRAARERLGLGDAAVILTVGRLDSAERYKGHDRVIAALPRILRDRPDALYVVAGEGGDRARLERLARDANVAGRVRFVGRVADDDLPDLYRAARVFAMPSEGEGFGIVFLEAAACGAAVVAGAGDGAADALADGAFGVRVDPHDQAALAAAVLAGLNGAGRDGTGAAQRFAFSRFAQHVDHLVTHRI